MLVNDMQEIETLEYRLSSNLFGYETKFKREQILNLPKTHYNDAIAICCEEGEVVEFLDTIYYKRHVSSGDYQQHKGKHSEIVIPTGKLFGLRKFDLIQTSKGTGFVKGKRSRGTFVICDIFWNTIAETSIKKHCKRITARTTTLMRGYILSRQTSEKCVTV